MTDTPKTAPATETKEPVAAPAQNQAQTRTQDAPLPHTVTPADPVSVPTTADTK